MNVSEQARRAYAPTHVSLHTPRSVEARLLSQITSRLQQYQTSTNSFADLVDALHQNREMWTTLASDVADEGNGLPQQLRAQIFYLAEFTDQHSQKVLKGEADVSALIDINTAILRGLNSNGAG